MDKRRARKWLARAGEVAGAMANPLAAVSQTLATVSQGLTEMNKGDILELTTDLVMERLVDELGEEAVIRFLNHLLEEVQDIKDKEDRREAFRKSLTESDKDDTDRQQGIYQGTPAVQVSKDWRDVAEGKMPQVQESADDNWRELLNQHLKREEGWRTEVYEDHLGNPTVGIGHLLTSQQRAVWPVGTTVPDDVLEDIFSEDVEVAIKGAKQNVGAATFHSLGTNRKVVLCSLCFMLGTSGLSKFRKMLAAIEDARWNDAADELMDSLMARQVPERAKRLATALATGTFQ